MVSKIKVAVQNPDLRLDAISESESVPVYKLSELVKRFPVPTGEIATIHDGFRASVRKEGLKRTIETRGKRTFTPQHGLFDIGTDIPEQALSLDNLILSFVYRVQMLSPHARRLLIHILNTYCQDLAFAQGEMFSAQRAITTYGVEPKAYTSPFKELVSVGVVESVSRDKRPEDFYGAEKPYRIKNPLLVAFYRVRQLYFNDRTVTQQIMKQFSDPEAVKSVSTFADPLYAVGFSNRQEKQDKRRDPRFLCVFNKAACG